MTRHRHRQHQQQQGQQQQQQQQQEQQQPQRYPYHHHYRQRHRLQQDSRSTTTGTSGPSDSSSNNGLSRSATLTSRLRRAGSTLNRSLSLSAAHKQRRNRLSRHYGEPWEIYFDPNYTFFGGKVLDRRKKRRQHDRLQDMALQDRHLHLHPASSSPHLQPPPSSSGTLSTATLSSISQSTLSTTSLTAAYQPTLPHAVMNAVQQQLTVTPEEGRYDSHVSILSSTLEAAARASRSSPNLSDSEQPSPPMNEQEHHARLELLKLIRGDTYHELTFPSMAFDLDHVLSHHDSATHHTAAPLEPAMTLNQQRTRRTRYPRWMERKKEALKEKCQVSSSTLELTDGGDDLNDEERRLDSIYNTSNESVAHNTIVTDDLRDQMNQVTLSADDRKRKKKLLSETQSEQHQLPRDLQHKEHREHQQQGRKQQEKHQHSQHEQQKPVKKGTKCRLLFLYFCFGFLFPPIWVIGALYTPPEKRYQSSKGRRIDLMWKRACRMAFACFTVGLLIVLILILTLNPGALGWRTSTTDQKSAQKFVPVIPPVQDSISSGPLQLSTAIEQSASFSFSVSPASAAVTRSGRSPSPSTLPPQPHPSPSPSPSPPSPPAISKPNVPALPASPMPPPQPFRKIAFPPPLLPLDKTNPA